MQYAYTYAHIDNMVTCIFKNQTCTANPKANTNLLLNYFNKYSPADLILEPRDGLKYYEFIEKIAFDEAHNYEVTKEEIYALRIDLPNHIINKCALILNAHFNISMHAINFLVPTNVQYRFNGLLDDFQFVQFFDLIYGFSHYSYENKMLTIYSLDVSTSNRKDSIDKCLRDRYPNVVEIQYLSLSDPMANGNNECVHKFYSGIWCVAWALDILIEKRQPVLLRPMQIKKFIFDWFLNFVKCKQIVLLK